MAAPTAHPRARRPSRGRRTSATLRAPPRKRPAAITVRPNALTGVRRVADGPLKGQLEAFARVDLAAGALIPYAGEVCHQGRYGYEYLLPPGKGWRSGLDLALDPSPRRARAYANDAYGPARGGEEGRARQNVQFAIVNDASGFPHVFSRPRALCRRAARCGRTTATRTGRATTTTTSSSSTLASRLAADVSKAHNGGASLGVKFDPPARARPAWLGANRSAAVRRRATASKDMNWCGFVSVYCPCQCTSNGTPAPSPRAKHAKFSSRAECAPPQAPISLNQQVNLKRIQPGPSLPAVSYELLLPRLRRAATVKHATWNIYVFM